ncbi:MAG TPA: NAD(P)-dependent glycerol-3-phosphate dehydrogenase [Devosia sp.]|nr:NAD(P)-dependent glycerol-3-phosphate dehydrogenase [Devosia sp.]
MSSECQSSSEAGWDGKICVIGAGAWGSALAQVAALGDNDVILIGRDKKVVSEINANHTNQRYLGAQELSKRISASTDMGVLGGAGLVLLAVPAQQTRIVVKAIPKGLRNKVAVIVTAKGFEKDTLALQSEIVLAHWPDATPFVLSGPSFAADVVAGRPTAVTLAGKDRQEVGHAVSRLASERFRPYASFDPLGVQLAGGLKNVYALACGAVEGAGLGLSARSALIARAHAEMGRLIVKLGGEPGTAGGLAGLGDLTLSCTSFQSRNYRFGLELGRGRSVEYLLGIGLGLAEGVATAPVAKAMAEQNNVEAPLIDAVNRLLEGEQRISDIVETLMRRPLKQEG